MKGAQLGATEAALNWLGYIIHHAPGLALLVMPSLDMARRSTRTRLDPMIEATPVLRDAIAAPRSRDAHNSAFAKSFPGGMLVMTGANSAAALRSTPARYLALDEVDGFPPDCGGEGDPVALAIAPVTWPVSVLSGPCAKCPAEGFGRDRAPSQTYSHLPGTIGVRKGLDGPIFTVETHRLARHVAFGPRGNAFGICGCEPVDLVPRFPHVMETCSL